MVNPPRKKIILLSGPSIRMNKGGYGGGFGGYVRNMNQHLTIFYSDNFELRPCFHTVRKSGKLYYLNYFWRFIKDIITFFCSSLFADGVHILAQYRQAIYREYAFVVICKIIGLPVLYDIKAGCFLSWLKTCGSMKSKMAMGILRYSKVIFCEGIPYVNFLKNRFNAEPIYFPNYVSHHEIPKSIPVKLKGETIKVLFVGYCYKQKGVFDLLEGCRIAASNGLNLELTFVGEEAPDFRLFLDSLDPTSIRFMMKRMGKLEHGRVLDLYAENDVFCMATKHPGEGHNNSINEAMMMGLIIITTRQGFLESVLEEEAAYFLEKCTPKEISDILMHIDRDRITARRRAKNARTRLRQLFTSNQAKEKMESAYLTLVT